MTQGAAKRLKARHTRSGSRRPTGPHRHHHAAHTKLKGDRPRLFGLSLFGVICDINEVLVDPVRNLHELSVGSHFDNAAASPMRIAQHNNLV